LTAVPAAVGIAGRRARPAGGSRQSNHLNHPGENIMQSFARRLQVLGCALLLAAVGTSAFAADYSDGPVMMPAFSIASSCFFHTVSNQWAAGSAGRRPVGSRAPATRFG